MNILVYAALSILPLGGLFLLALGARNVWRGVASTSWPQASGVVIVSGVPENTSSDTTSSTITVAYKVNGREYKTDTIHFGESAGLSNPFGESAGSSNPSDAEIARLRYPKGAEVSVAYHPQKPAIAALKPGFAAEALTLPVVGLAVTLIGAMAMLAYHPPCTTRNIMPHVLGAISMLIGVALLSPGVRHLLRASESSSWPKAPGVILSSTTTSSGSDQSESEMGYRRATSATYYALMVAEYEVNGRKHYSNTRRFGEFPRSDATWAQEIAARYPKGAKVQVAYSPADPDLAVLEPGITSEAYLNPGAGAVLFLFGLIVVLVVGY